MIQIESATHNFDSVKSNYDSVNKSLERPDVDGANFGSVTRVKRPSKFEPGSAENQVASKNLVYSV